MYRYRTDVMLSVGSTCLHSLVLLCSLYNGSGGGAEALRTWTISMNGDAVEQSFILSDDIGGGDEESNVKLVYQQGSCHLVGENIKNFQKLTIVAENRPVCVEFYENDKCSDSPAITYLVPGTYDVSLWMYKMFKACSSTASGERWAKLCIKKTLENKKHSAASNMMVNSRRNFTTDPESSFRFITLTPDNHKLAKKR